jgi:hypothetical protein
VSPSSHPVTTRNQSTSHKQIVASCTTTMMIVPSLPQQRYAVTFCHSLFLLSILGTWKAISVANQIHDRYTLDIMQQPCNECQKIITATFLLYILVLPQAFSPLHHPLGRAGGRSDQRTEENYKQISVVFFFFLRSHLKGLTLSLSFPWCRSRSRSRRKDLIIPRHWI